MGYAKNIKLGSLLGIFFSVISFIICIAYVILASLPVPLLAIIIIYAIAQILIFIAALYLNLNLNLPSKTVFVIGIVSLFALLAPGIIILVTYFKKQKQLLNEKE